MDNIVILREKDCVSEEICNTISNTSRLFLKRIECIYMFSALAILNDDKHGKPFKMVNN